MYLYQVFIITITICGAHGVLFDRYRSEKIDYVRLREIQKTTSTQQCTANLKPCVPHEGSRVDGSCNNYKYPTAGTARGPYLRLLKPDYAYRRDIRKNRNGDRLPSARRVRTTLQTTGRVEDKSHFDVAAAHFLQFILRDVSYLNGPSDFLRGRQYCCKAEGEEQDPRCRPIEIPQDDPYLKVTDIRCQNFSRADTFQDLRCIPETIPPEQINYQTPLLDLSTIYGVDEESLDKVRSFKKGLLELEIRGDFKRYVPLSLSSINNDTADEICSDNRRERNETICYLFGFPEVGNTDLRTTTFAIFFMREHNRLAQILHELNPCWGDDRLFKVARQINIATAANIFLYELLPALLGNRNMIEYKLISDQVEHIAPYEEGALPLVYAEFEISTRFFHTFLDGRIKRYNEQYQYIDEFLLGETQFHQALIEKETNFEEINRGTFYQNAAKIDDIQDPEISENYYSTKQRSYDLAAEDIQRGRDLGIRGYNDYRHLCGFPMARKFEDFLDVMTLEKVEALKKLYEDIDDVELLAGVISESFIHGTFVGPTLFCIINKQLNIFRYADRFWFERGDQFHSFNIFQLHEIRKTNMARFACDNVEAIKYIQPQAFLNVVNGNTPVPCTHIPGADLSRWRDASCHKLEYNHEYQRFFCQGGF